MTNNTPSVPEQAPETVRPDPWSAWRAATPARVALCRAGNALPTRELLDFGWAHAMARDAIHVPLDAGALTDQLQQAGWTVAQAASAAPDRMAYLRRPDLGRQLDAASGAALCALADGGTVDLSFVIGDGLSSLAVTRHAVPLLQAVKPLLPPGLTLAPVVVATQARAALADEVAECLRARLVVMLIGERPGLSSPDSLGVYISHAPRRGLSDAQRNCISNVRPEGLGYEAAAFKLAWLVREALRRGLTGVALKDESDLERLAPQTDAAARLPGVA
jgi:ethanolamine ammonia-lyase small subunit